jgi:hypothetical protein
LRISGEQNLANNQTTDCNKVTKADAARTFAVAHYEAEPGLTRIIRFTSSAESEVIEPIKLLEVNEATVPSGVMPLHFGPAPASGVPFPSVIVEVTPEEFDRIQRRELQLPPGWERAEELPKPSTATAGAI